MGILRASQTAHYRHFNIRKNKIGVVGLIASLLGAYCNLQFCKCRAIFLRSMQVTFAALASSSMISAFYHAIKINKTLLFKICFCLSNGPAMNGWRLGWRA